MELHVFAPVWLHSLEKDNFSFFKLIYVRFFDIKISRSVKLTIIIIINTSTKLMKFAVGRWYCCFVFRRFRIQISERRPGHVTEGFYFPQTLQTNAGTVFPVRARSLPTLSLTVRYSLISYHMALCRPNVSHLQLHNVNHYYVTKK